MMLAGAWLAAPSLLVVRRDAGAIGGGRDAPPPPKKTVAELVAEARARSRDVRGLYMTAGVASGSGDGAQRLQRRIIDLADRTEINAIVIDVKEVCGPEANDAKLKRLLAELRAKNIWAIARIVAFKDASQMIAHPDWYITRKIPKPVPENGCGLKARETKEIAGLPVFWRDDKGGYWMDPASPGARAYLVSFAKRIIDLGFDELQFDYVRFPSDGDVSQAIYPAWDRTTPRHRVLRSFFILLRDELKTYKPDVILSADLFGYVAAVHEDQTIGQRLYDIGDAFDYVSFMVYPSHYYTGLALPADPAQGLPAVSYTYAQARAHPDVVVSRSLLQALDYFAARTGTSTLAATTSTPLIRPWLEDFFHEQDRLAGRPYGDAKVRMQIDAAERTTGHGWLLWNASNVYTEGALAAEERK